MSVFQIQAQYYSFFIIKKKKRKNLKVASEKQIFAFKPNRSGLIFSSALSFQFYLTLYLNGID